MHDAHKTEMRVCPFCEAKFIPKRKWQKFCCSAHQKAYHTNQTRLARENWYKIRGDQDATDQ